MFHARLEGRRAKHHLASAGGAEPVRLLEVEVVEDRLRRLLPFMGQEHALAKRTALAWTVEGDDR